MQVSIYFTQFLKDDAVNVGGGGIGTLISFLCPVLEELGHAVTVYQCASHNFDTLWGNTRVVGIPVFPGQGRPNEKVAQHFRDIAARQTGTKERIEIFAGDFFAVKNDNPLAICIQNGLAWDAAIDRLTPKRMYHSPIGEKIFRYRCQLRGLRRFETCYNRVAVDLYFLNWYRSFRGNNINGRLFYNPNPAPEAEWMESRERKDLEKPVNIIFARRFVPEKGTRVIAAVFREILQRRPNVRITLAGEGPDEEFFRKEFAGDPRVDIICYRIEEALVVHRSHDIAVIPSLCGEATCLAVLEGMSAGCAVLATDMGGTITEIIDGFNGILCQPNENAILAGLLKLIDDSEFRLLMQKRGWEVSQTSFRLGLWKERWGNIIETIVRDEGRCRENIADLSSGKHSQIQ